MKLELCVLTAVSLSGIAGAAVWPNVWGDMKHAMIGVDNGQITAHLMDPASERIEMMRFPGESYSGAAAMLDDKYYSSQYGWLADGFISLNPGEQIVIENISGDTGLEVYEGGMRAMAAMHSYDPLFGTAGSPATNTWDGMMRHDWFAATAPGDYEMTFRIYVADDTGTQVTSYGEAGVTFLFSTVPAPGAASVLALGGLLCSRRRRRAGGGA